MPSNASCTSLMSPCSPTDLYLLLPLCWLLCWAGGKRLLVTWRITCWLNLSLPTSRFLPKVILLLAHISITMLLQFTFHWEHFRLPIVGFWMLSLPKQVPLLAHIWIDVPQWFACHWEHLELSWNCSQEAYHACRTLFSVWNQIVVLQFLYMCASMPRVQAHREMCVEVGCLSELSLLQDYSCAWKENAMGCSVLCGSMSLKLYLLVLHWSLRTAFTITLFVIRCFLIIELHSHLFWCRIFEYEYSGVYKCCGAMQTEYHGTEFAALVLI